MPLEDFALLQRLVCVGKKLANNEKDQDFPVLSAVCSAFIVFVRENTVASRKSSGIFLSSQMLCRSSRMASGALGHAAVYVSVAMLSHPDALPEFVCLLRRPVW